MKFDYLAYIGRFNPFHVGHYNTVKKALEISENVILVLGSHEKPTSFKDPFTTNDRIQIIMSALSPDELNRVHFAPQHDHVYNEERWIASIQGSVRAVIHKKFVPGPIKVGMIGFDKDHSSYYLRKFPDWELIEIDPFKIDGEIISATDLRNYIYGYGSFSPEIFSKNLWRHCNDYSVNEKHRDKLISMFEYDYVRYSLHREWDFILNYSDTYGPGPFITADSVVSQSGHLLVIKRGGEYCNGMLALPGGFVNPTEKVIDASVRELKEETDIDLPVKVLYGSIVKNNFYDKPDRDARGRVITFAYHYKLNDAYTLPKVKAKDDAKEVFWITLEEFRRSRSNWFADHYDIVEHMLGI
jgi:bifunctional NMN adenylyltransferase/nudix hydrolase